MLAMRQSQRWTSEPIMKRLATLGLPLALSACTAMPPFGITGDDPLNPDTFIRSVAHSPVTSGHVSRRPVEPAPWGEVNRQVAPGS